jgi:hypothetical protein
MPDNANGAEGGEPAQPARKSHFSLPPPSPMNLTGNLAENWKNFEEDWKNWATATKLNKEEPEIVLAALKHVMGRETQELCTNLQIENRENPQNLITSLRNYFIPRKNITYERYVFNTTSQSNESIDLYLHRLRRLASTCDFGNLKDSLIRDRIVIGISDNGTRERLLREDDPNLEECLKICRAAERTQEQLKAMTTQQASETVHKLKSKNYRTPSKLVDCDYCGEVHKRRKCPAYGTKCSNCKKMNHFASVCKSTASGSTPQSQEFKQVRHKYKKSEAKRSHQVKEEESSESDIFSDEEDDRHECYSITKTRTKYMVRPLLKLPQENKWTQITVQIDNGSEVNCLRKQDLLTAWPQASLEKTQTKLKAYGDVTLKPVGKLDLEVNINGRTEPATFLVVNDASVSLLSGHLCEKLGLISVNHSLLVNQVKMSDLTKEHILEEYKDVFDGLGYIGDYSIHLKENAKPSQDSPRTVPVALRKELKARLDEMEQEDILMKVTQPTDWVSSAVYVKRPNKKLRVCLDPQTLNKYVQIPKFRMPTLEDITPELHNVRVFSVCDAKDGFLQIALDEKSALLTTFHTPFGRYAWKRLPFGISSAPEEFQRRVLDLIDGLPGVYAIADDCVIVVQGSTLEAATADHDNNFLKFLDKCRSANFKLNKSKLKFRLDQVKYHGHILTSQGLLPDPEKVSAIQGMPRPRDKAEV